jgi:predicted porin
MKKTLIALAVLASSGVSFAQVTVTGNLTMGYKATSGLNTSTATTPPVYAANDASGFGVDTSQINFSAKEDLGGGMKISADMALGGADRSHESTTGVQAVSGRDATLALTTGAGRISLKSYEVPNYLTGGLLNGMGPGQDDKVFGAKTKSDAVAFDTVMGPFSLGFEHRETAMGIGAGASGSALAIVQRTNLLSGTYAAGPLAANLQYGSLDNRDTVAPLVGTTDSSIGASATYDFGMAKVGAAMVQTTLTSGVKVSDSVLAVSLPLGAATLSANWATNKNDSANVAVGGTKTGYGLKGEYSLSKRTSMIAQYARWDLLNTASSTMTRTDLLLSHSF